MKRALCWLRRDLRLHDHAALARACEVADEVAVVFVFDTTILDQLLDRDDARVSFIYRTLREIDAQLRHRGSRLVILHGDPVELIPWCAREWGADVVVAAEDYEPVAIVRDSQVAQNIRLELVKDQVIFAKREVLSGAGEPFKVFTPYSRAWLALFAPACAQAFEPDLGKLTHTDVLDAKLPDRVLGQLKDYGFLASPIVVSSGGDQVAEFGLRMDRYAQERDFVDSRGVSRLSVHLRFGTVSIRECVRLAQSSSSEGARKWLTELIWREFYQMILSQFPHVVDRPFKPEYEHLNWPGLEEHYRAWEEGRTGYPIVDASMRCLNATGWMHNRARMISAMFLTKDLLVDYRRGETHFARKLLDFDLAQNNGGWQWSASTGVDAQPYFRIFNPYLQSRKFDPDGSFIRQWCPELAHLSSDDIHEPPREGLFDQLDCPPPIVDHATMRERAIQFLSLPKKD